MRWTGRIRFLFLMPAVVWVLAFTVFPLGYSLYLAFYKIETRTDIVRKQVPVTDEAGKPRMKNVVEKNQVNTSTFIGLDNFRRMLGDAQLHTAIWVTFVFVIVAVPLQMILGFLLALLFNQAIFARPVLRTIMILPIFATPIAMAYSFFTIFYEQGGPLGWTHIPFLSNPSWALVSVIIVDVWQWTPFCFLVFLAALQGVPDELIEAARIDGASAWDILARVLLPVLQPTIVIVLLIRLAESLKVFDIPFALTGGGPGIATQSYSLLAYRTGLRFFDLATGRRQ